MTGSSHGERVVDDVSCGSGRIRAEAPVLRIRDLTVRFGDDHPVVDGIGLEIHRSRTVALVGESGSGKSMTALAITGLLPPGAQVTAGTAALEGEDLIAMAPARRRRIRGRRIAMVFQDPMTALNPVLTVGEQLLEAARLVRRSRRASRGRIVVALEEVRLPRPRRLLGAYPHELSGGMRQRVMIAMALLGEPVLLIADEPTTALDVTVQAEVLTLLDAVRRARAMSMLLITHDLGIVAGHAQRVAVMRDGRIVEMADVRAIFEQPAHPYTRGLLAAIPTLPERTPRLRSIEHRPESETGRPAPLREIAPGHWVAEDAR
jgi:oligopeptide/dipeptide ABC transporter ATP-binding protein